MKRAVKRAAGRGRAAALALALGPGLACGLAAPAAQAAPKQRIADLWYAHNALLVMLGASDRVVATVARPEAFPWMMRVAPALRRAEFVPVPTASAEALLQARADLVFVSRGVPTLAAMQRLGLNVVPVGFDNYDSMLACIDTTAAALDSPLATARAHDYRAYLAATLAGTRRALAALPAGPEPRVLHVASLQPLKVDGTDTIVDAWLHAAGARNAADGLRGNLQTVSIEQVLAWHPDAIILGANAGTLADSRQRALWDTLDAVRQHRVYRNPAGVFPWDRYGPEAALQIRWAAGLLHPGSFANDPMPARVQAFYRRFYGYALSADDTRRILDGQPPAPER